MSDLELGSVPLARRLGAEVVGTAALTFVAATTSGSGTVKTVAPALVVGALVFAIGSISGALINPAVTLGFALRRAFPWRWVPAYWAAQLAGGLLAGLAGRALVGLKTRDGVPQAHVPTDRALVWEVLLTALLVLVILGTATKAHLLGPESAIPVAAMLAVDGLLGGPYTGASMNPARALGPAWAFGTSPDLLVYVVGPLLGAAAAAALAWAVLGPVRPEERHAAMGDGA